MEAVSNDISQLLSVAGAAWTATLIFALLAARVWSSLPHLLDKWLAFRTARAAEKAADWTRLRDELIRLSEAESRCRRELADVTHELAEVTQRLAILEGYNIGRGQADQLAQMIVSSERQIDADKREDEGGK